LHMQAPGTRLVALLGKFPARVGTPEEHRRTVEELGS
jgi:hypothetical protein